MCRMAAYAGPQAPLSVLLSDPPWALREQAWRARRPDLSGARSTGAPPDPAGHPLGVPRTPPGGSPDPCGAVNVDGTGVVWWPAGEQRRPPLRYVTELPPWADPNLLGLAGRLQGAMQLALVRSATPGLPYGAWSVAPFVHGRLAVAHNGRVGGFRGVPGRRLLERLPDDLHAELRALTDSAALAALVAAELRERPEQGLAGALAATVATAEKLCAGAGETATLTLLAADGERIAGVRAALGRDSHPLFTRAGGGVALAASEPLDDDPAWVEVPDRHLVELGADGTSTRPLD